MPDVLDPQPLRSRPAKAASHLVLIDDWREHLAGRILPADPDVVAALTEAGVEFRDASEREIALAGVA